METNLDQKQLLVLGYLRELLNTSKLHDYQLGFDDEIKLDTPVNASDSPAISALTPFSRFDEHMQLFNLGAPKFELPRSNSINSVASDLSDHSLTKYSDFTISLDIIQNVYLYFNRSQNYLLLMGGSEDCRDNSYNQIQIINLRNISDIKQKIDYPYTNYRLRPVLWRESIDYDDYFTKSFKKYLVAESKVVATTAPITQDIKMTINTKPLITQSKTTKIKVSVDSPHSPWTAINSPYSPFAQLAANNNNNFNISLTPFAQIDEMKQQQRQRAKSTTNIAKLAKKDKKKLKNKKKMNANNNKYKIKSVSMKKRKSTNSLKKKSKSTNRLMKKKPEKRRASTMLPSKKGKNKNNCVKNVITNNDEFDKYSFGECIMNVSNGIIGTTTNWPWFKGKYKSEIRRYKDNLEFAKYKMFVRCGGIYTKDDEYSNQNDLIMFNAANLNDVGRQIDSFYCKLPPFKQRIEGPALCYNGMNNLLSFGGYSYDDGKALKWIYSLNLNVKRTKFKWRKYSKSPMNMARYDASITHIINNKGQNKFMIIGGKGSSTDAVHSVEMFNSSKTNKESKCIHLAELHFPRFKCGSCQLNNNKIAVCGGMLYGKGAKQVEIYDLNKDKWIIHGTSLHYDHQHPNIWSEVKQINPNILYVAGNNISFGAKKGSLGFIEWTDLRVKQKKFKLLYDEPLDELYEFWGFRANIWEPRSLLHFAL